MNFCDPINYSFKTERKKLNQNSKQESFLNNVSRERERDIVTFYKLVFVNDSTIWMNSGILHYNVPVSIGIEVGSVNIRPKICCHGRIEWTILNDWIFGIFKVHMCQVLLSSELNLLFLSLYLCSRPNYS